MSSLRDVGAGKPSEGTDEWKHTKGTADSASFAIKTSQFVLRPAILLTGAQEAAEHSDWYTLRDRHDLSVEAKCCCPGGGSDDTRNQITFGRDRSPGDPIR